MGSEVLLTIGIPCFNEERYLSQTLESVSMQTFKQYVVYICDDCSSDKSLEIAKKYAATDRRISILESVRRGNFVENWNKSLDACNSKYFVWIGAHDILHPQYLSEAIEILENNTECVMVYPTSISIDSFNNQGESMDSNIETIGMSQRAALLKVASNLNHCTAIHGIFRSEILKKLPVKRIVGFDFLIIFLTSIFGQISKTKEVRFFRRIVREESHSQAEKRWKESGMFEVSEFNNFTILAKECLLNYKRLSPSSIFIKILVINSLAKLFCSKFNLSKTELVKALLKM